MKSFGIVSLGLFALVAVGCNSGLDQQSATKVMTSALGGTGAAQAQLKPLNGATSASFDGTITNPAGSGSAHAVGSATQNATGWDVKFDITFTQWTDLATNVTLDGALHESASFTTMSPYVGSVKITGGVKATGAVQSSVDFDLALDYAPTKIQVKGDVGGASLDASLAL